MLHVIGITALVTALIVYPAGIYTWYRWGPMLKADAQKVETAVTSFTGKGNKASGK